MIERSGTVEKLTDNEIISELSYKLGFAQETKRAVGLSENLIKSTLDLVEHTKAENENLYYKLRGVMHFVDKWLNDNELEQDEVQRADTMRENILQIIERQEAEIERLKAENVKLTVNMNAFGMGMRRLAAEIEKTGLGRYDPHTDSFIKETANDK